MNSFHLETGLSPLLISVPHAGTELDDGLRERLSPTAATLPDTDWFVDELYGFARALGVGMIRALRSRYVIDLNRPPGGEALHGSRTTGLVPRETFDGSPLYRDDYPDEAELRHRVAQSWRPYHEALEEELGRLQDRHGHAVLLDAHSIRSEVPTLFDGVLPHFSLGTAGGVSAAPELAEAAFAVLDAAPGFQAVRDARFKGGYITRHHGRPHEGRHALQLELAQRSYMQERPVRRDAARRAALSPVLQRFVTVLAEWRPA